jgi:GNAT superfamily N-acetyltransferase
MAMDWSPNNLLPELSETIEIVKPESISDLEQWLTIVNTELIAPLKLDFVLMESMLAQAGIEIFLLKYNGIGVSTCLLHQSENSTGLYLIATLKSAQKQGLASLLVRYILARNSRAAKNPVVLHATPSGEPLYLKLGFQSYGHFFLYRYLNQEL